MLRTGASGHHHHHSPAQPWLFLSALVLFALMFFLVYETRINGANFNDLISKQSRYAKSSTPRKVWTVISTQCAQFQDWNVIVAAYSHEKLAIPGNIVRLMACNDDSYEPPASSYSKFSVVRIHDYNADYPGDDFPPRNKAFSLRDWLAADDSPVGDDDIIILMDPDQIFVSQLDISQIRNGRAAAARYDLNSNFLKVAAPVCGPECEMMKGKDMSQFIYGAPYILTAGDARRLAPTWANLTETLRLNKAIAGDFGWLSEMYTYIMIAIRFNIVHEMSNIMISNVHADGEPWEQARWYSKPKAPLTFIHYCQSYEVGDVKWGKHSYHQFDIRKCDPTVIFPELDDAATAVMKSMRGSPLTGDPDREHMLQARSAWLYDNVVPYANNAFRGYYEDFCRDKH